MNSFTPGYNFTNAGWPSTAVIVAKSRLHDPDVAAREMFFPDSEYIPTRTCR
jgi:hypothetical protein